MVEEGKFRSDLLFRLRSFIIELPPLRERREDIRDLAHHYVDRFCDQYALPSKGFSPDFLDMLMSYPWPGNVREFINTLDRTLATARFDQTLYPKHLPNHIRVQVRRAEMENETAAAHGEAGRVVRKLPKLQEYRDAVYAEAEKQYLNDLMDITQSDIGEACRISGLSQSRLYALLKKNQISRNS
jgi:two-component system NtrC family response regulator